MIASATTIVNWFATMIIYAGLGWYGVGFFDWIRSRQKRRREHDDS